MPKSSKPDAGKSEGPLLRLLRKMRAQDRKENPTEKPTRTGSLGIRAEYPRKKG